MKIYSDFPALASLPLNNGREMTRARINNGGLGGEGFE